MTIISNVSFVFLVGIIEGITEFFPISSSSHIIIITKLFNISDEKSKIFNIIAQSGTALSILLYFKKEFLKLFLSLFQLNKTYHLQNKINKYHIIVSSIPISLIGLNLHDKIQNLFSPKNIIYPLICGSMLLLLVEILKKRIKYNNNINLTKALIIGFFQCLALFPGFSRSCSTISGGILLGFKQSKSVKFSFLLSVPIIFGALIVNIIKNIEYIHKSDAPLLLLTFIVSFVTSQITIKKCLIIISNCSFIPFIIYRLILSMLIYYSLL